MLPKRIGSLCAIAMMVGLTLPGSAGAMPTGHVLLQTPTRITHLSLDRDGSAAWIQLSANETAYRIHRGRLLSGQNAPITDFLFTDGPQTAGAGEIAIAATARSIGAPLHIVWGQRSTANTENADTLYTPGRHGGRVQVASLFFQCGEGECGGPGVMLGPVAARDGVTLYGVDDVKASCSNSFCTIDTAIVTGGHVRRVRFTAAGTRTSLVPGTPAAARLTTAGGRLAEQLYTPAGDPAPTIEIRNASSGALGATIHTGGTIDAIAMSQKVLAVLTTTTAGNHLVRYDATTGGLLGSSPIGPGLDTSTLAIFGPRIVYQTSHAVLVYRIDLGRTITVHTQTTPRQDLVVDEHGIRWITVGDWVPDHGAPTTIHGIEFG